MDGRTSEGGIKRAKGVKTGRFVLGLDDKGGGQRVMTYHRIGSG